jgi:hypothetical protein
VDFFLYDGYLQYKFVAVGDVWVSFDLEVKIPKIVKADFLQNAVCAPSDATGGKTKPDFKLPKLTMKTSLFIKNDLDDKTEEGELLVLAAVEEIRWIAQTFIEISLGTAVGALRVRSAYPDCQPSGLFISADIETDFGLGKGLKKFLRLPNPKADIDFGVTWLDQPGTDASDAIQSFFFRTNITDYQMMGITVEAATIEIQYFDDKEFIRRRDFDKNTCCALEGVSDCSVPNNALETFINRGDVTAQPTIGLFLTIQDLSWYGSKYYSQCGLRLSVLALDRSSFAHRPFSNSLSPSLDSHAVVKFSAIELEFIYQLDVDDFATRFYLFVACQALFIDADLTVLIESTEGGDNFIAAFEASIEANVGAGTVTTYLAASASVGDYIYTDDTSDTRALQGGSLEDADWDLDFYTKWETAQWLKDLGEFIWQGLKALYEVIKFVWDKITEGVTIAWNAIKNLANVIGGAIADLLTGISDKLDELNEELSEGIDAAVNFLDGEGAVGEFAADVLNALDDIATFSLDRVTDAVDFAAGIFSGDWSAAGEAAANLFGCSKSVSGKKEKVVNPVEYDKVFGCPLRYKGKLDARQRLDTCLKKVLTLNVVRLSKQYGKSANVSSSYRTPARTSEVRTILRESAQ